MIPSLWFSGEGGTGCGLRPRIDDGDSRTRNGSSLEPCCRQENLGAVLGRPILRAVMNAFFLHGTDGPPMADVAEVCGAGSAARRATSLPTPADSWSPPRFTAPIQDRDGARPPSSASGPRKSSSDSDTAEGFKLLPRRWMAAMDGGDGWRRWMAAMAGGDGW